MSRTVERFGYGVLIDCHSMPSTSLGREEGAKADIVLGDRYGASCAGLLTDLVEKAFAVRGYSVIRNKPYAGGYITEHYGAPGRARHALQIEVNRSLYMDERTLAPTAQFARLARDLASVFADVMPAIGHEYEPRRIAAE